MMDPKSLGTTGLNAFVYQCLQRHPKERFAAQIQKLLGWLKCADIDEEYFCITGICILFQWTATVK